MGILILAILCVNQEDRYSQGSTLENKSTGRKWGYSAQTYAAFFQLCPSVGC